MGTNDSIMDVKEKDQQTYCGKTGSAYPPAPRNSRARNPRPAPAVRPRTPRADHAANHGVRQLVGQREREGLAGQVRIAGAGRGGIVAVALVGDHAFAGERDERVVGGAMAVSPTRWITLSHSSGRSDCGFFRKAANRRLASVNISSSPSSPNTRITLERGPSPASRPAGSQPSRSNSGWSFARIGLQRWLLRTAPRAKPGREGADHVLPDGTVFAAPTSI
jgi:hypothetical protein